MGGATKLVDHCFSTVPTANYFIDLQVTSIVPTTCTTGPRSSCAVFFRSIIFCYNKSIKIFPKLTQYVGKKFFDKNVFETCIHATSNSNDDFFKEVLMLFLVKN